MRISTAFATVSVLLVAIAATGCSTRSKTTGADAGDSTAVSAADGQTTDTAARPSSPAAASPSSAGGSSADLDACTLLTTSQASTMVGKQYTGATPQTIAAGQDQCTYRAANNGSSLVVIVYQPDSGVTFDTLTSVQTGAGQVTSLSGVGDKAIIGAIELDAQVGNRLVAVQGAGGTLTGDTTKAIAVTNAIITALH